MALRPGEMPGEGQPAAETEADWRVASDGTAARPMFTPAPRAADDDPFGADEADGPVDAPTTAETEADEHTASDGTAARPMFTPAPRAASDGDDEDDGYEDDGPIVYEADEPVTYEDEDDEPEAPAVGTASAPAAGTAAAPAAAGMAPAPAVSTAPAPVAGADLGQPLLSGDAELLARWQRVQAGFIDDPQAAVAGAADLIEQAGQALVDALRQRQHQMRTMWDRGPANGSAAPGAISPDTEQLRQVMRRYRALFDQLYPAA